VCIVYITLGIIYIRDHLDHGGGEYGGLGF
jgi:hypothetical protein